MEPRRDSSIPPETAFRRLFSDHYRDVLRYVARRSEEGADVEDAAAEVFTVAWRRIADRPSEGYERAWLFAIAARVLANQRRSRRRLGALKLRIGEFRRSELVNDQPDDTSSLGKVLRAFKSLRPGDQEVLRLAAWEGLSNAELSLVLACSENAAALRLHRARRRLAEKLKKTSTAGHSVL